MSRVERILPSRVGHAVTDAAGLVERVAFWCGVVLPCLHIPLLVLVGLGPSTTPVLVALWAGQAVALAVGARYDPEAGRDGHLSGDSGGAVGHGAD